MPSSSNQRQSSLALEQLSAAATPDQNDNSLLVVKQVFIAGYPLGGERRMFRPDRGRVSIEERLDQLAILLEQDIPLSVCHERMGYSSPQAVYALFAKMRKRLGPQAR